MFLGADIPIKKENSPSIKELLSTYTGKEVPDESALRRYYVPKLYDKTWNEM